MQLRFHFPPILKKHKRGPAIIHPKDAGLIIAYTGLGKESIVVEAGAGSGFLTTLLANVAKKIYSYEKRPEFFKLANTNLERAGITNVELIPKDILEGISQKDVDVVTLDMPDAEKVVPLAYNALKSGGWCVGYLPNIEQAKAFYTECHKAGFEEIFMIESLVREFEVREYGVRPQHIGLMHTAYLVFARK